MRRDTIICDMCGVENNDSGARHDTGYIRTLLYVTNSWLHVSGTNTDLDFCGKACIIAYYSKDKINVLL